MGLQIPILAQESLDAHHMQPQNTDYHKLENFVTSQDKITTDGHNEHPNTEPFSLEVFLREKAFQNTFESNKTDINLAFQN